MMTHSMVPPMGVWNVRAIDGRLMLTIEASSIVMNVPIATKRNVAHGFTDPSRWTDEFATDTAPVPLVSMIAAGAEQMEEDAAETGLSEISLHRNLIRFSGCRFSVQSAHVWPDQCRSMVANSIRRIYS